MFCLLIYILGQRVQISHQRRNILNLLVPTVNHIFHLVCHGLISNTILEKEQKIAYTHMSKYQELLPNQVEVRRKNEEKRPCLYVYKLTLAAWQDSLQPI